MDQMIMFNVKGDTYVDDPGKNYHPSPEFPQLYEVFQLLLAHCFPFPACNSTISTESLCSHQCFQQQHQAAVHAKKL